KQLKHLYKKSWERLLANAGVQQFFPAHDKATKDYISKRCGEALSPTRFLWPEIRDVCEHKAESQSRCSVGDAEWCFIGPQEVMPLDDNHFFMFAEGSDYPIEGHTTPYWQIKELEGLYCPDHMM